MDYSAQQIADMLQAGEGPGVYQEGSDLPPWFRTTKAR